MPTRPRWTWPETLICRELGQFHLGQAPPARQSRASPPAARSTAGGAPKGAWGEMSLARRAPLPRKAAKSQASRPEQSAPLRTAGTGWAAGHAAGGGGPFPFHPLPPPPMPRSTECAEPSAAATASQFSAERSTAQNRAPHLRAAIATLLQTTCVSPCGQHSRSPCAGCSPEGMPWRQCLVATARKQATPRTSRCWPQQRAGRCVERVGERSVLLSGLASSLRLWPFL